MNNKIILQRTLLSILIGSIGVPYPAIAVPLDLAQVPPGETFKPPAPNIIISIDDSGSMDWDINGCSPRTSSRTDQETGVNCPTKSTNTNPTRMTSLKSALTSIFNNPTKTKDDSFRLGWTAMHNNGNSSGADNLTAGAINSIKTFSGTHRNNFISFVNSLNANGGTPTHELMYRAHNYMKSAKNTNSPWGSKPGVIDEPYLGCRRAYHIVMTDGAWSKPSSSYYSNPKNADSPDVKFLLGDNSTYYPPTKAEHQRIYKGTESGTLSDWALLSWATDLQPGITNDIKPKKIGKDSAPLVENYDSFSVERFWNPKHNPATWQHLVQYSIGYGRSAYDWSDSPTFDASGNDNNYAGQYPDLVKGTVTGWSNISSPEKRPADLWHMALNSRGKFYPARSPESLEKAFFDIMSQIEAENAPDVTGITTSSSSNRRTDIASYVTGYDPEAWSGYIYANSVDKRNIETPYIPWGVDPGKPFPKNRTSTADKLDLIPELSIENRLILTTNNETNAKVSFEWEIGVTKLSATQKAFFNDDSLAEHRINFLRGDLSKEGPVTGKPFRTRASRQGDIVNSNVWYVAQPESNYSLPGYLAFTKTHKNRIPMLYVGGNDGMLHGFSALDGAEKIAYIPKGVIKNLPELTKPGYAHKFYVDGSPFTGDVDFGYGSGTSNWNTLLVGTLGAGGRGYFILNVTTPGSTDNVTPSNFSTGNASDLVFLDKTQHSSETPAVTTEDADIGHIFAAPVVEDNNQYKATQITRMNNGRWAAIMGNGYNSVNERPVLLIQYLDGDKKLDKIIASTTGSASGNGLSAPRLVDINGDGTTDIVYAGDLKGNLWKFNLSSDQATNWTVDFSGAPLYQAKYKNPITNVETVQPITAPPTVRPNDKGAGGMMVAFGTGQNLTSTDRAPENQTPQTIYSIVDQTIYKINTTNKKVVVDIAATPARIAGKLVEQKTDSAEFSGQNLSTGRSFWKMTKNDVKYAPKLNNPASTIPADAKYGWYFNLPVSGERLLKPISFYDGSNNLEVLTQVPGYDGNITVESCTASSSSEQQYRTFLNIMTGNRPGVQVMDTNGDGVYNSVEDKDASRMKTSKGAQSSTSGEKTITTISSDGTQDVFARMPEQSLRPSWRQLQ